MVWTRRSTTTHQTHESERAGGREGEIEIKRCAESGHPDVNFEFDVMCHNVVLCRVTRCLILASRNERFIRCKPLHQ